MKKLLLFSFALILNSLIKSQIVFCPSGAEWHFLQKTTGPNFNTPWIYPNETIKYVRDTVIDNVSAKVLRHSFFLKDNSEPCTITLIKQSGDTVFMRNEFTLNAWQVLSNFNATAGQSWNNSIVTSLNPPAGSISYTTTLDSVNSVIENGFNLKKLYVKQYSSKSQYAWHSIITERYGSNEFLFNFSTRFDLGNADPFFNDWVESFLCYSDANFGIKQFGSKDCHYQDIVSVPIDDAHFKSIKVFPNPVMDVLKVEGEQFENVQLSILDVYGKELKFAEYANTNTLNVSNLNNGLYFVVLKQDGKVVYQVKFIKE